MYSLFLQSALWALAIFQAIWPLCHISVFQAWPFKPGLSYRMMHGTLKNLKHFTVPTLKWHFFGYKRVEQYNLPCRKTSRYFWPLVISAKHIRIPNWKNYIFLATSCKELTHWKRLWCWEGLGARGEGHDRGWNGWMASLTRWTWVWVDSGSWWWTGRPGVLRFMGSQRVGHD